MVTAVHMVLGGGGGSRERGKNICVYMRKWHLLTRFRFFSSQASREERKSQGVNWTLIFSLFFDSCPIFAMCLNFLDCHVLEMFHYKLNARAGWNIKRSDLTSFLSKALKNLIFLSAGQQFRKNEEPVLSLQQKQTVSVALIPPAILNKRKEFPHFGFINYMS